MQKAYDTILQSEVTATLAAQSGGFEQFRYECACCGEEVYVAAPFSNKQVAHFRHRNGNNDVECENYLGQFGILSADSHSRKSNRERAEFYFDYSNKIFCLGIKFSENEIRGYETQGVYFELRAKDSYKPFAVLKINSQNFAPEAPTTIPLNTFSYSYYLSNTGNGAIRKYDFFNRNAPTFFKILGNEEVFLSKLVRSTALYTDTRYFVTQQSLWPNLRELDGIAFIDTFFFDTMGHRFTGWIIKIIKKTPQIDSLLRSWGYQLESSETLSLLWPPSSTNGEITEIHADVAFLYSSFVLKAHGNVSLYSHAIDELGSGVSRISLVNRVKVFQKNAEILIEYTNEHLYPFDTIQISYEKSEVFEVPDDGMYFVFNCSGAASIRKGQRIFITRRSKVKHYIFGYLDKEIRTCQHDELCGYELLLDIVKHNKRIEEYNSICFDSISLSDTALGYISGCEKSGAINSVVKQYILEGKL